MIGNVRPGEAEVILSWTEVLIAAQVGVMRNVQSLRRESIPGAGIGLEDTWTPNIEGAAGEMAVAKYLNVYWDGKVGDYQADDVGPYQVRTNTSRRLDDMILRPKDRADRAYFSVLSFLPRFVLCGWIAGSEGKRKEWSRQGSANRPPCYFVPRSALQPMPSRVGASDDMARSYDACLAAVRERVAAGGETWEPK